MLSSVKSPVRFVMLTDIRKQDGTEGRGGGTERFWLKGGWKEEGGGVCVARVASRGEMTVVRDMHTVSPPGHGGNKRGRHDELCWRSDVPKRHRLLGEGVCMIGFGRD